MSHIDALTAELAVNKSHREEMNRLHDDCRAYEAKISTLTARISELEDFSPNPLAQPLKDAVAEIGMLRDAAKGQAVICNVTSSEIKALTSQISTLTARLERMQEPTIRRALKQYRIECFDDSEFGIAIDAYFAAADKGIGKPVHYSDGELSREIEEGNEDGNA